MLAVNNIEVLYDRVILVLKGASLNVPRGGIVALLGANGAGKTTTLKAISNLLRAERREVAEGTILVDERAMGLAPQIVEEIFEIIGNLNAAETVSFLLAEQNTHMALKYARYGSILENGRVVMDGEAKSLAENEDVKEFYLGIAEGKRKSFRDVKHYKRRKRWLA